MATHRDKTNTKRCVYVIPSELHGRIAAYQAEHGIATEVEAARRLLDHALQTRDTHVSIANRFKDEVLKPSTLRQAAANVLAGHPLIQAIEFDDHFIKFSLTTGEQVTARRNGEWVAITPGRNAPQEAA